MTTKDIQQLILSNFKSGNPSNKIFRGLKSALSRTIDFKWCNMVKKAGSLKTCRLQDYPRRGNQKNWLKKKSEESLHTLEEHLYKETWKETSKYPGSANILNCHWITILLKKCTEPKLTETQKGKRIKLANWVRCNQNKIKK